MEGPTPQPKASCRIPRPAQPDATRVLAEPLTLPLALKGKLASHPHRIISLNERHKYQREDFGRVGNIVFVSDQHLGKGLHKPGTQQVSETDAANAAEAERNFNNSVEAVGRSSDKIQAVVCVGDLSDSSVPYELRAQKIISGVRAYSEALDCARTGKRVSSLLGNHDCERALELYFRIRGATRCLPLHAGRLVTREALRTLQAHVQIQTDPTSRGIIIPSQVEGKVAAELIALNKAFGRSVDTAFNIEQLQAVVPDRAKLEQLHAAIQSIPGAFVLQKNHHMGTLVHLGNNVFALLAHDPIINGENLARILTQADPRRPTVRLGNNGIRFVIIGDQHTVGLVENLDFDTVCLGSLGGLLSREIGNPPTVMTINPFGYNLAHFWELGDAGSLAPLKLSDIGFTEPMYYRDARVVSQMFDPRQVLDVTTGVTCTSSPR